MAATSDHDPAIDDLSRELYSAQERASRARMDTAEVRDRLHDLSMQLRADEKVIIPQGEGNLASTSRWRRQLKYGMFRVARPFSWRYDRLLADHAELTTSLAERVMALEAEVARLRAQDEAAEPDTVAADADTARMRVAVLHPQTAFVRGGAETHAEGLVRALRAAGHDADLVQIAGKWYPASPARAPDGRVADFDITESNGLKVDAVVGLKFPAYLVEHERKIVWLMHQHRTAYELWDPPRVRGPLRARRTARRCATWFGTPIGLSLNEAKRVFANSKNVKDRLWSSLRIPAEVLYHPSPVMEHLMDETSGPLGDFVLFPSRMESLKRQSLVIDAMQHVRSAV